MFCKNCGSQLPEHARHCGQCGAPVENAAAQPGAPYPPTAYSPQGYGGYPPPGGPPKQSRTGLWIGVAVAAVIVIAAAVAVPLLLLRGDDDQTATTHTTRRTTTTSIHTASSTTDSSTTSTASDSTSTSTSTSTTAVGGAPGDSAGEWVETLLLPTPEGSYMAKISDQVLLVETNTGAGYELIAHPLGSDVYISVPISGNVPVEADIDGQIVVWRDGTEEEDSFDYVDTSIKAFVLPTGPVINIAAGQFTMTSPQIDGGWISWAEREPSDFDAEQYWYEHIYLQAIDASGTPVDAPVEFVSSATAYKYGDSSWMYSMSDGYVAWEESVPHRMWDAGSYACGMGEDAAPQLLGGEAWRPSLGGSTVLYWDGRLMATDLATQATWTVDSMGDYATAAPTYAVYVRPSATSAELRYEIVARGYGGTHEQILLTTEQDPYFMVPAATSDSHIALLLDDGLHVFEWQAAR